MLIQNGDAIYIAELRVPSYFYLQREIRDEIPNPNGFGIHKGYWRMRPQDEQSEVVGYVEIALTIEFVDQTLREAEEHSLKVGRAFSSIVSAYGGYPLGGVRLKRVASKSVDGYLKSQHNYWYGYKSHNLSIFNQAIKQQFQQYLKNFSQTDGKTRHLLQSAIHWYGIAISADDPTVSLVAAWTGLESIGLALHDKVHPNGPKAPCETCNNKAGEDRKRKIAGIEHAFRYLTKASFLESVPEEIKGLIVGDIVDGFSAEEAARLRNDVVHGSKDKDIEVLQQQCSEVRRHLLHVLNASILGTMGPSTGAWLAGHYEVQPEGRFSLKFKKGTKYSPFLDEWVKGPDIQPEPTDPSEGYLIAATVGLEWRSTEKNARLVEAKCEELFRRDADVYSFESKSIMTGVPTWQDRAEEPVWKEFTIPET